MLLLNLVRVLITLFGLVVADAMVARYELQGLGAFMVLGIVLMMIFVLGDVAEEWLIRYFNPEDDATPA